MTYSGSIPDRLVSCMAAIIRHAGSLIGCREFKYFFSCFYYYRQVEALQKAFPRFPQDEERHFKL